MSESFRVESFGAYHQIRWGQFTCALWADEAQVAALCDLLETTRHLDALARSGDAVAFLRATDAHRAAWVRFRDLVQGG